MQHKKRSTLYNREEEEKIGNPRTTSRSMSLAAADAGAAPGTHFLPNDARSCHMCQQQALHNNCAAEPPFLVTAELQRMTATGDAAENTQRWQTHGKTS
jgi:Tfp pilus assembly protein PilX